jgi:hypothetical protein
MTILARSNYGETLQTMCAVASAFNIGHTDILLEGSGFTCVLMSKDLAMVSRICQFVEIEIGSLIDIVPLSVMPNRFLPPRLELTRQ